MIVNHIRDHFVPIPREILESQALSLEAKGLMACLSMEDGIDLEDLLNRLPDGDEDILSALEELKRHGYVWEEERR